MITEIRRKLFSNSLLFLKKLQIETKEKNYGEIIENNEQKVNNFFINYENFVFGMDEKDVFL